MEEIDDLEQRHGVRLPDSYRRFLEVWGRGKTHYFVGSAWAFDSLDSLQQAADELLREGGYGPLPQGAFVFMMHQGYQFYFFWNDEVWYYIEGAPRPERRYASFDEFSEGTD